jgi:hypothetical protein
MKTVQRESCYINTKTDLFRVASQYELQALVYKSHAVWLAVSANSVSLLAVRWMAWQTAIRERSRRRTKPNGHPACSEPVATPYFSCNPPPTTRRAGEHISKKFHIRVKMHLFSPRTPHKHIKIRMYLQILWGEVTVTVIPEMNRVMKGNTFKRVVLA